MSEICYFILTFVMQVTQETNYLQTIMLDFFYLLRSY